MCMFNEGAGNTYTGYETRKKIRAFIFSYPTGYNNQRKEKARLAEILLLFLCFLSFFGKTGS